MSFPLTQAIQTQITNKRLITTFVFKINSVDRTPYCLAYSINYDRSFGSAAANFELINAGGIFSDGGSYQINIGDVVELIEGYGGDSTQFKKFYGIVNQRSISKTRENRTIVLSCLDYVSVLQNLETDLILEGTKEKVTEELLTPQFLPSPNNTLAQVFNFANNSLASVPSPIITIRPREEITLVSEAPQSDGFDIKYADGQLVLGTPINASDNYDIYSPIYYFYTQGLHVEDIIETILKQPDGYGGYLFGESTSTDFVNNHLISSFIDEEGSGQSDYLSPNFTSSNVIIKTQLAEDYFPIQRIATTLSQPYDPYDSNSSVMYLTDTTGFEEPESGETTKTGIIGEKQFTYTGIESGNRLVGVSGVYVYANAGEPVYYKTDIAITELTVESTEGLPSSGTASINGDTFTWSSIESGNRLVGIPTTGSNKLSSHKAGSYIKYEFTAEPGRIWYHKYSNITSSLSDGSYSLPSGSIISYKDYRLGRIILDSSISTSTIVTYDADYNFKTLQATGVEINRISFRTREIDNRFDALAKLREYLAPNYIIRTQGDNKIWASYLYQKTTADYTLNLIEAANYLEDDDLYTRVKFFGKNINPTNLLLQEGVGFVSTGINYSSVANQIELIFEKEEDNFQVYKTGLPSAGKIDISTIKPVIYINNVPINDKPARLAQVPIGVTATQRTETITEQRGKKSPTVTVNQYFYYKIRFAHGSIDPTESIIIYDALGDDILTISPGDGNMNYAEGIYNVPGDSQNTTIEQASTAQYTVFYSTTGVEIDYSNVRFKLSKQLIPNTDFSLVRATFQYWTALTPFDDIGSVIDGRYDTQVQTEFYAEPPTGLPYAIIDLGAEKNIQAIDFVSGFFKADEYRKFDVDFSFSLQYSLDNVDYFSISDKTENINMSNGNAVSLEENDLGIDFSARYLRLNLQDVAKLQYKDGVWVVALSEVAAYDNIILSSEAKLIPTTYLDTAITIESTSSAEHPTTVDVISTSGFTEPESGETTTAYIEDDLFYYTGLTTTSFTGVTGLTSDHTLGARVSQSLENDTDIYDYDNLLPHLGDRLYKKVNSNDEILFDQERLNALSKAYLSEFVKNHSKLEVNIVYMPQVKVGDTVQLTDSYQNISALNYFVEAVNTNNGAYTLTLARYPD